MATIIKRSKEIANGKVKFTFSNGVEIIADKKIANEREAYWQDKHWTENIELEDEYKQIYRFFQGYPKKGDKFAKYDLSIDWETTFEDVLAESVSNTQKAREFGMW